MKLVVLVCALAGLVCLAMGAPDPRESSYGEMALALIPPMWQRLLNTLPRYTNTSCQSDSDTRYTLVYFREQFAVFTFAYPLADPRGGDLFRVIYQDVSEGYQLIGKCWDVIKLPSHTPAQLDKISKEVYQWKVRFERNMKTYDYTRYVVNPSKDELYYRRPSQLSYQYWGSSKYLPQKNLTALSNLARLVRGQFETLLDLSHGVFNLTSPWREDQHEEFHDYRKLARYATYLIDPNPPSYSVPEVLTRSCSSQINFSWTLQSRMGKLNDMIVGYQLYVKFGNTTLAENQKTAIMKQYPAIQDYERQGDWPGAIKYILDSLVK